MTPTPTGSASARMSECDSTTSATGEDRQKAERIRVFAITTAALESDV